MRSRHVSQVVAAPADEVYRWVRDPDHLPLWASGLATSPVRRQGDDLLVDSPMGAVRVSFAEENPWGVLDHDVTLPDGTVVNNPLRVLPHPDGAELVFTVRQLDLGDEDFDCDCATVAEDLARLAGILDGQAELAPSSPRATTATTPT